MVVTDYVSRRNSILEVVVDSYVSTAAPVGSLAVSKKLRERLSPATIRNIMCSLEEAGYITHPHTSAGRIPTDMGYRYFVDSIMEPKYLTQDERDFVEGALSQEADELEDLIKRAARIISGLTGQTSLVSFPRAKRRTFKRIELIPATKTKVYALLFTAQGLVKHSIFEIQEVLEETELSRVSKFLNDELDGLQLNEIADHLLRRVIEENDPFHQLFKEATELLNMSHILEDSGERILLDGAHHMMEQPEFRNAEKVKRLMKVLEEEEEILDLMDRDMNELSARIHIGSENPYNDIKECSIVISNYRIGNRNVGSIGVIGPTRMDYPRAVPAVEFVSDAFSRLLTRLSE
ncbi:MAG: heat-inducible transcriptional repressor HrcA [Candidatus Omnitrophica bacterium]|jgi:heat-inducible transcriptional repressor|nr:heat-inducible transcriptional repressor HrcA [Candidatus Omnitrophota bacterium]